MSTPFSRYLYKNMELKGFYQAGCPYWVFENNESQIVIVDTDQELDHTDLGRTYFSPRFKPHSLVRSKLNHGVYDGHWDITVDKDEREVMDIVQVPVIKAAKTCEDCCSDCIGDCTHGVSCCRSVLKKGTSDVEVMQVDPVTGGRKAQKLARFDLIPPDALWELAELYGKGAEKYGESNWKLGYNWSWSIGALHRHLNKFEQGEDIDSENDSSHLQSVIFHAIALWWFQKHGKGTDDRSKG